MHIGSGTDMEHLSQVCGAMEAAALSVGSSIHSISAGGGSTVTPSKSSYAAGETVVINFTNMPGNAQDWLAIALPGSPDTSFVKFAYTGGLVSGTKSFTTVANGTYVARAFFMSPACSYS